MLLLLFAALSVFMLVVMDLVSYLGGRRGWPRFVCTFLLFYAQVIGSEFLLGLFSLDIGPVVVVVNAVISAAVLLIMTRKHGGRIIRDYFRSFKKSAHEIRTLKNDPFYIILLALTAGFVAWIVYLGVLFPSLDYDGNSYHLTFSAYVLQNHTFFDPQTSLLWLIGYPKGGEFTQLWSMLILHRDTLADLAQVPFLLLGIYALYSITTALGAKKQHARFAALIFFFLPIVINQLKTPYVDVMLISVFFASIALIIQKKFTRLDLVLIGITFSLLLAIKSTGSLYLLVLVPLLVWRLYLHGAGKATGIAARYVKPLLLVAAPMFFGVYWYAKNWFLHATPIYPFGFTILGIHIFNGKTVQQFANAALVTTSLPHGFFQRIWYVWTEQSSWFGCLYNYDTNYAGMGPIWFIVLLPATLVGLYLAIRRRNYLFLGVAAVMVALYLIYPDDFYPRYTMFIAGLGIAALGLTLSHIDKVVGWVIKGLVILLAVVVIATNFTLCSYGPTALNQRYQDLQHGRVRGTEYDQFIGPAYTYMEAKLQPGNVVVYDSKPFFIYPLWRPDFSNTVLFIPAKTEAIWYQRLYSKKADYVFTTIGSKENRWARTRLRVIYRDSTYEIFQVN